MITVTRLNGTRVTVNALFIETVEETPDTIITLTTGKKIVVTEKTTELVELAQEYFKGIGIVRPTVELLQSEGS
ncbi:flagellar FlbD family protein [Paenibacillus sp.]|uniref:flagellar FlbD family protein n=1 Tax=Paenibacillus sp. TaxID=58172 RepID=UPI002D2692CF|nr:flagellar FlbD family protein [Paenibacillus sp.]HZG57883.1 flagellar FlbD family protein [Paenibacillus sp.]